MIQSFKGTNSGWFDDIKWCGSSDIVAVFGRSERETSGASPQAARFSFSRDQLTRVQPLTSTPHSKAVTCVEFVTKTERKTSFATASEDKSVVSHRRVNCTTV